MNQAHFEHVGYTLLFFGIRKWSLDARLDLAFPVIAVVGVALFAAYGLRGENIIVAIS